MKLLLFLTAVATTTSLTTAAPTLNTTQMLNATTTANTTTHSSWSFKNAKPYLAIAPIVTFGAGYLAANAMNTATKLPEEQMIKEPRYVVLPGLLIDRKCVELAWLSKDSRDLFILNVDYKNNEECNGRKLCTILSTPDFDYANGLLKLITPIE